MDQKFSSPISQPKLTSNSPAFIPSSITPPKIVKKEPEVQKEGEPSREIRFLIENGINQSQNQRVNFNFLFLFHLEL